MKYIKYNYGDSLIFAMIWAIVWMIYEAAWMASWTRIPFIHEIAFFIYLMVFKVSCRMAKRWRIPC